MKYENLEVIHKEIKEEVIALSDRNEILESVVDELRKVYNNTGGSNCYVCSVNSTLA